MATPAVVDQVVIPAALDDTLPASQTDDGDNDNILIPVTPDATSSPRRPTHSSPDHGHLATRAAPPPPTPLSPSFSLDDVVTARIPVLRYCPKTARRELASQK